MAVERLRGRRTFERLSRRGRRARHGPVSVTFLPAAEGDDAVRVGYAIGKPVGSAVDRNRLRRRLRAIVATLDLAPGAYLVRVGVEAGTLGPEELRSTVEGATSLVIHKVGKAVDHAATRSVGP